MRGRFEHRNLKLYEFVGEGAVSSFSALTGNI
jgi:hypothetical protein